jgi:beta-lactamase regulating signal transducer with metallopeptidase domain
LKPVVLLPVSLVSSIPLPQLEAILAHELAHIRRHDFIINLAQTLMETLFFYHPAIWWLSRRIRVEREHCCDDLVVKLFNNGVDYGRALLAIEQLQSQRTVLSLGAADGSLLGRIRRISGATSPQSRFFPGLATAIVMSVICGMWTAGQELIYGASVVSHADGILFSAARARVTFSRMSSAFLIQTKVLGLAL